MQSESLVYQNDSYQNLSSKYAKIIFSEEDQSFQKLSSHAKSLEDRSSEIQLQNNFIDENDIK